MIKRYTWHEVQSCEVCGKPIWMWAGEEMICEHNDSTGCCIAYYHEKCWEENKERPLNVYNLGGD